VLLTVLKTIEVAASAAAVSPAKSDPANKICVVLEYFTE
jgi:hypothetical protein